VSQGRSVLRGFSSKISPIQSSASRQERRIISKKIAFRDQASGREFDRARGLTRETAFAVSDPLSFLT
jgi:hypothetical protein